jgi:peptide chain release factor subunit 1
MAGQLGASRIPAPLQANEIDTAEVRRLAELRLAGHDVVSLYLDLDPASAKLPRARRTQLESLLGEVEQRHLGADGGESHERRAALAASLERIRRFFAEGGLAERSARAVAVFSSHGAGLFEAYRLPRPVQPRVSVGDRPFVEPLLDLVTAGRWAVLLVSRRAARLLHGSAEALAEAGSRRDDVHRRHSQGGWSQARFARGIEKETLDHVKGACEWLFELYQREPFEHLILGGPDEVLPVVEEHLHPYLRDRLAGRIEVDVERASAEDVLERARGLIAATEREQERELLDRLAAGLGTGSQAVAGRDQVLAALGERRVDVLAVAEGEPAEEEIELAIAQGADTRVIRHLQDELRERGSIAALLRY